MRKRILLIGISISFILGSCGLTHNANGSSDSDTAENFNSESNISDSGNEQTNDGGSDILDREEVQAYKSIVEEHLNTAEGFRVALIRLDNDDIYELAIIDKGDDQQKLFLYTYNDEQVVDMLEDEAISCSILDSIGYYDSSNLLYVTSNDESEYLYTISEHKAILENCLEKFDNGDEIVYKLNSEEISEDEYDSFNEQFDNDSNFVLLDYSNMEIVDGKSDIESSLSEDYYDNYYEILMRSTDFPTVLPADLKPVIYLYPEEDETDITVKMDYDGTFIQLDPKFNIDNGWKVVADADGTIRIDDNSYEYLFWEGIPNATYSIDKGFCVAGKDTKDFLDKSLSVLGLNEKEKDEFIDFWLPKMEENNYNLISFQTSQYTDHSKLMVYPKADSVIRVFMTYKPSGTYVDVERQELSTPDRRGFTVVEWGGSVIK